MGVGSCYRWWAVVGDVLITLGLFLDHFGIIPPPLTPITPLTLLLKRKTLKNLKTAGKPMIFESLYRGGF